MMSNVRWQFVLVYTAMESAKAQAVTDISAALEARALKMRATLEPSDPFVDELRAVLRKHLAVTDISLATVAGALGLSEPALQRRLDELDVSCWSAASPAPRSRPCSGSRRPRRSTKHSCAGPA